MPLLAPLKPIFDAMMSVPEAPSSLTVAQEAAAYQRQLTQALRRAYGHS
jgi:hypothetical protein